MFPRTATFVYCILGDWHHRHWFCERGQATKPVVCWVCKASIPPWHLQALTCGASPDLPVLHSPQIRSGGEHLLELLHHFLATRWSLTSPRAVDTNSTPVTWNIPVALATREPRKCPNFPYRGPMDLDRLLLQCYPLVSVSPGGFPSSFISVDDLVHTHREDFRVPLFKYLSPLSCPHPCHHFHRYPPFHGRFLSHTLLPRVGSCQLDDSKPNDDVNNTLSSSPFPNPRSWFFMRFPRPPA